MIGKTLGSYRVEDKIGQGGMGEVYRARDTTLDRDVAVKVLPGESFDDPLARARLLQEARAAAALNHPHICTVYEVGETEGQTFIAMELVDGRPLSDRLDEGPLSADEIGRYSLQLADALAHAHDRGVVHRDLKSANIIVRPDGRVKVLDFGLAKRLTASELTAAVTRDVGALTQPGTVMGTVAYMAPEQLRGEPAQMASDVWALGVVLYEMVLGERPFRGQTGFELSASILNYAPEPLPDSVDGPLRAVIGRCLEKEPMRRYQTGSAVHAALETGHRDESGPTPSSAASSQTVTVAPSARALDAHGGAASPVAYPARVTLSRRRVMGVGLAAATVMLAGLVVWQVGSSSDDGRTLAVLPFENTLADEEADYLADGLAESLIEQVAILPSLRVSPLSAVLNFKGQSVDPVQAGRLLGVESVLTGSLSVENERLLVTAGLVDVESGTQLWADSFGRDLSEFLTIQDEIATAMLAEGLRVELTDAERIEVATGPTVDGEA